jgi:hypothetical protein
VPSSTISGTPKVVELLAPLPGPFVEVFCRCDPVVAFERFQHRDRHPGHADQERDVEATRAPFFTRAEKLPLRMLGPVVEIDTERAVDVAALVSRVAEAARRAQAKAFFLIDGCPRVLTASRGPVCGNVPRVRWEFTVGAMTRRNGSGAREGADVEPGWPERET